MPGYVAHPTAPALLRSPRLRAIEQASAHLALMQRAGEAAADWAGTLVSQRPDPILILAGPGNNGGDALVAARLLRQRGYALSVAFAGQPDHLPADARAAYDSFLATGGSCRAEIPRETRWGLIIDGIFGIGLSRAPEGCYADWIRQANALSAQYGCPILALDCPSGLDADRGAAFADTLRATHTLSFIAAKPGFYTGEGPDHCGALRIAPLGLEVPGNDAGEDGQLITRQHFADTLKPRSRNTHKGSFGSVGVAGGAASMQGAAILAARAALKLGAGRVYLGLIDAHAPHLDPQQPELMLRRPAGLLDAGLSALACGPGLGGSLEAVQLLETLLASDVPLVLDADALSLLAQEHKLQVMLASRASSTIITPHPGEAARLQDTDVASIQADRIGVAISLARRFACHVVIKGCGSVVAAPDGRWWINTTGNPGMASAGMGDILTGMLASLLAQRWPAQEALLAAVHLHGAAADALVAQGIGPIGLTASEVIDAARQLLNQWIAETSDH